MLSRSIQSFLAFSLIALAIPPLAYADEGYIGADVGTDLYRKVDSGYWAMKKALVEKRVPGSAKRMNETIKKQCPKMGNADVINTGKEFTTEELSLVSKGVPGPIFAHLKPELLAKGISTDLLSCAQEVVSSDFARMLYESSKEQRTISKLGSIGLYSDGSIDNSSFDLMYDLDRIHDIIFAKDIPYNGKSNPTNGNLKAFLSNPNPFSALNNGLTLSDRLSYDLADSGWTLVDADDGKPVTTWATLTGAYCATGTTTIAGIDPALIQDFTNQTEAGTNNGTESNPYFQAQAGIDSVSEAWDGIAYAEQGGSAGSRFGCTGFFCINVDFVTYNGSLLWGGKSYSIESLLQQNLKIVLHYAGSSFAPAQMTRNFFECSFCKYLNLPGMGHIWVVVRSLPAPILNLSGKNTPRGEPKQSDKQREFEEFYSNVLSDYGLNVKRQNALLENKERNYGITLLSELTTDYAPDKLRPVRNARANYYEAKERAIKTGYYDAFTDDLLEFQAFTKTFSDNISNFVALVKGLHDIPQE